MRKVPRDISEYGPRMMRLTPLQRNYVKAMAAAPFASSTEWCRLAGYSDKSDAAKVTAFRLRADPKLEEAALEYAAHLLHRDGPTLAVAVMMQIARDNGHPKQLAAAEAIADRIGLHRLSEHRVRVEHTEESAAAKAERIRMVAGLLGVDVSVLLGANNVSREAPTEPKLIEGRAEPDAGKS